MPSDLFSFTFWMFLFCARDEEFFCLRQGLIAQGDLEPRSCVTLIDSFEIFKEKFTLEF